MDRSMDSIGSCSLDVDADSTDFSDTSDSLNICTPLSGKDITREFTSRIHERCQLKQITPCQKSAVVLDPASGKVNTVLSSNSEIPITQTQAKKPSYLNLACCVNGYSNLTTYDSQLRQNINKSRGASPIRPITRTALYTSSEDNYLMIPALSCVNGTKPFGIMDNDAISPDKRYFTPSKCVQNGGKDEADNANLPFYKTNKNLFTSPPLVVRNDNELKSPKSFIQQRVERLYGPGALAQGFYSPKRTNSDSKSSVLTERSPNQNNIQSKLFKTNYSNGTSDIGDTNGSANSNLSENYQILDEQSLPVLRHLRPEFRAQLPMLSPKRSPCKPIAIAIEHDMKAPSATTTILSPSATTPSIVKTKVIVTPPAGEIDASSLCDDNQNTSSASSLANGATIVSETVKSVNDMTLSESNGSNGTDMNSSTSAPAFPVANGDRLTMKKDGNYFLNVINVERERLLGLALQVEKDTEMLLESGISSDEEIIGSLRSASGKARLLVSQKIQQFEGLCHNSLNQKPGEKYPTTSEDLQGFWDMVLLQVDHVDSLFQEMNAYRSNNWKKPPDTAKPTLITAKTTSKRPLTTKSIFGNSYSSKSLPMSMSSERANAVAGTQQIISSNKQKSAASIAAAQRRELQRKQLLELKRKNKMLNSEKQQHEPDIDICIDKNSYTS